MASFSVVACSDQPSCWDGIARRFAGYASIAPSPGAEPAIFFTSDADTHAWLRDLRRSGGRDPAAGAWTPLDEDASLAIARHDDEDDQIVTSQVLIDRAGILLIAYPSGRTPLVQMPFRQLRAWLVLEHRRRHWHFLHASAAAHLDRGVVVIGDKFAGKTSTLLWLLASGGFDLVANDQVAWREVGQLWKITGFPIAAGVRAGTLACFPQLRGSCADLIDPGLRDEIDGSVSTLRWSDRKISLPPQRLASHFSSQVRIDVDLAMVLVPRYDATASRAWLERVPRAEAAALLQRCSLDSLHSILPLQRFLEFLEPSFSDTSREAIGRLSDSVPVYGLVQNERTGDESAMLVRAACVHDKSAHACHLS